MWDVAGEQVSRPDRLGCYETALLGCRSIIVAIDSFERRENSSVIEDDQTLGSIFRRLLRQKNSIRQVLPVLMGIDVYAEDASEAQAMAIRDSRF